MLDDPIKTIASLAEYNIQGCICPAVDFATSQASITLAQKFPGIIGSSIGLHPNEQEKESWQDFLSLADNTIWAIGETGLDYYRDMVPHDVQQNRFSQHIALAQQYNLPLIVHTRESSQDVLAILKNEAQGLTVILHSFTESLETAYQALDLGCYLSFSGIVTFKNAVQLRETLKMIPLNKLLIETDTPYLSPEPYRGRINHPKNVLEIAKIIALQHSLSLEHVAEQLLHNTSTVFTKISSS